MEEIKSFAISSENLFTDVKIVLEEILTIMPEEYEKGTEAYYINKIKNLKN